MAIDFTEEILKSTPKSKKRRRKSKRLEFVGDDSPLGPLEESFEIDPESKTWRTMSILVIVLLAMFLYLGRSFILQIIQGEENLALSEGNRIKAFNIPADRGAIYDRNGDFIVRNKPSFIIEMNTAACARNTRVWGIQCKEAVEELSKFVDIDKERVFEQIDARRLGVVLASEITKKELLPLEANLSKYPSVSVSTIPQRDYLYGESFAHLIGYVGFGDTLYTTIEGKTGVEQSYNEELSGIDGSKITQVDSSGQSFKVLSEKRPVSGRDITLYVDLALQQKAYELLKTAVDEGEATGGAIVAQDPRNGGILAMVSYPSFDPNKFVSGISQEEYLDLTQKNNFPFFNRVISAVYPPGSVFKLVMASAVLAEDILSPNYLIFDPGYIRVGEFVFRNWKLDGHGDVNLKRAVQVSNDTYFYTIGGGHKPRAI